jgi:hypothetical protein
MCTKNKKNEYCMKKYKVWKVPLHPLTCLFSPLLCSCGHTSFLISLRFNHDRTRRPMLGLRRPPSTSAVSLARPP